MGNLISCILPIAGVPLMQKGWFLYYSKTAMIVVFKKKINLQIMHLLIFIKQKLTYYLSAILDVLLVRDVIEKVVPRCLYRYNTLRYSRLPSKILLMRLFGYFSVNRLLMLRLDSQTILAKDPLNLPWAIKLPSLFSMLSRDHTVV